jgi:methylenetetrahydrofolate reductase (NADPH)
MYAALLFPLLLKFNLPYNFRLSFFSGIRYFYLMHINDIFKRDRICFSFEFFPPKDAASSEQLFRSIADLMPLAPSYVSVTYGAGGATRMLTHDLVVRIQKETNLTVVSHITCVGSGKDDVLKILSTYSDSGIENIMALRGDPPKGQDRYVPAADGFRYASELVTFVKQHFPRLGIGVAGYPEGRPDTPNRLKEIDYLKIKVDAGADYICSQLFFDNHAFYDFRERCLLSGITVPILAGIMPVTSIKGMQRMAELSPGTNFPARLLKALSRADNDAHVENAGIHWATEQIADLIDNGVKGVHFYTLNRSKATLRIYDSLGVASSTRLKQ